MQCDICKQEYANIFPTLEFESRNLCVACFGAYAEELMLEAAQIRDEQESFKVELGDRETAIKECLQPFLESVGSVTASGIVAIYVKPGKPTSKIEISWDKYKAMMASAPDAERVVLQKWLTPHINVTSGKSGYVAFKAAKEKTE